VNQSRHCRDRRDHQGSRQRDKRPNPPEGHDRSQMLDLCARFVFVPREGEPLDPKLFDRTAEDAAKIVVADKTKTSQLRRFYDELLRWEEKVNGGGPEGAENRLRESLPFIRMMNAKAAYAKGRGLVGESFVTLLRKSLEQVNDKPVTLRYCRQFFEAFMGFYRLHGPKD